MKKILFIILVCFSTTIKAQFFQTYSGDNYSGINGVTLQPASIADSRYKFDILLTGKQVGRSGNYSMFNMNAISSPAKMIRTMFNIAIDTAFATPVTDTTPTFGNSFNTSFVSSFSKVLDGTKLYRKSIGNSYLYKNKEKQFLSFMITLSPKDAIGFTKRERTITNVDGLSSDMALALFSRMDNPELYNTTLKSKRFSLQQMRFKETTITYARVLSNNNENFFKLGGSIKILNGIEAMYLYGKNIEIKPVDSANIEFINSNFSYGYSKSNSEGFNNKMSVGFDIGIVYEYRPDHAQYFYEMDGEKKRVRRDLNKYKFRLGASILDIGRIKFTKTDNSNDFAVNQTLTGFEAITLRDITSIHTFIQNSVLPQSNDNKSTFKMNLPTAISLQADYLLRNNIYAGYSGYIPVWLPTDKAKVHNLGTQTLSVRYENRFAGIAMPVSITRNGQVNAGINIRMGMFTFGTTNFSSYFFGKRRLLDLNIYFSTRMSLAYNAPMDKDGDKISDQKDICPTEPGSAKLQGCPDTDNDGMPDYKDYCPYSGGQINLNGCPDTDGDEILDYMDACPTEKGFSINKGCPDKDVDGIIDVADRCPDIPGIKENNGCPQEPTLCCSDSDGDGILDRFDDCPSVFGMLVNKGCPLRSGSTTGDNTSVENTKTETPNKDTIYNTNATVPNNQTSLNNTTNNTVDQSATVTLGDNPATVIYFNKDSYKLTLLETMKLNKIARQLTQHPEYKLLIQGHTDNDGDDAYNVLLSHKRALTVKKHLCSVGNGKFNAEKPANAFIDSKRVEILFFGESKPAIENSDPKKKEINRRVELILVK